MFIYVLLFFSILISNEVSIMNDTSGQSQQNNLIGYSALIFKIIRLPLGGGVVINGTLTLLSRAQ